MSTMHWWVFGSLTGGSFKKGMSPLQLFIQSFRKIKHTTENVFSTSKEWLANQNLISLFLILFSMHMMSVDIRH